MLQLGHAGEGVEMSRGDKCSGRPTGFNWATLVKAWRLANRMGL